MSHFFDLRLVSQSYLRLPNRLRAWSDIRWRPGDLCCDRQGSDGNKPNDLTTHPSHPDGGSDDDVGGHGIGAGSDAATVIVMWGGDENWGRYASLVLHRAVG